MAWGFTAGQMVKFTKATTKQARNIEKELGDIQMGALKRDFG